MDDTLSRVDYLKKKFSFSYPEIIDEYAEDIINIFDGKVVDSSHPYINVCIGLYHYYNKNKKMEYNYYLKAVSCGGHYGHNALGVYNYRIGKVKKAHEHLDKAIEMGSQIAKFNKIRYLMAKGRYVKAKEYENDKHNCCFASYYINPANRENVNKGRKLCLSGIANGCLMCMLTISYYENSKKYTEMFDDNYDNSFKYAVKGMNNAKYFKDYDRALKYAKIIEQFGFNNGTHVADIYRLKGDFHNAMGEYIKKIEAGNNNSYAELIRMLCQIPKKEFPDRDTYIEKYGTEGIEKNNIEVIRVMIIYYGNIKKDMNKALECIHKGLEMDDIRCIKQMIAYLKKVNKKDEITKYIQKAADKGNVNSAREIANMYHDNGDMIMATKYWKIALKSKGYKRHVINDIIKKVPAIRAYNIIDRDNGTNYVSNTKDLIIYRNKIKRMGKIGDCGICFDANVMLIPLECTHYFCADNCYLDAMARKKCPNCACLL